MVIELVTGSTLPACVWCGHPDATDVHHEEDQPPAPSCADAEACHDRRMRMLARDRDEGWVQAGTGHVEEATLIGYSGNVQAAPITPDVARAWSEEFPPDTGAPAPRWWAK